MHGAAIYALHRLGRPAPLKDLVELLLYSSDEEVRRNAALIFCELSDPGTKAVLRRALRDHDLAVRWYVYEALARLGEKEAMESLLLFAHSSYGDERLIGILALGRIGNGEAVSSLRDMLRRDNPMEVKLAAIRSLGQLGAPTSEDTALKALTYVAEPPGKGVAFEPTEVRQVRVRTMAALALAMGAGWTPCRPWSNAWNVTTRGSAWRLRRRFFGLPAGQVRRGRGQTAVSGRWLVPGDPTSIGRLAGPVG